MWSLVWNVYWDSSSHKTSSGSFANDAGKKVGSQKAPDFLLPCFLYTRARSDTKYEESEDDLKLLSSNDM